MKTEFTADQYQLSYPDDIEDHWWHLTRNRILANTLANLAGSGTKVLEVGCGRGIVVKFLRNRGIDCTGVELADVTPIEAVRNYIQVGTNAVDLPGPERQRYNIILLLDVIEHIPDPLSFLQRLTDAFPNLTHVIITVPARRELWSNYDDFYGHYRRYTIGMIKSLALGLRVKHASECYFFHSAYPLVWAVANLKKSREVKATAPRGLSRLLHKMISYAMILDFKVFPGRLPGTSILSCFFLDKNHAQPLAPADSGHGPPRLS